MPSIAESTGIDTQNLARVTAPAPASGPTDAGGMSPLMLSSLPAVASGADLLTRQFYSGSRVPQTRILPVAKKGQAR